MRQDSVLVFLNNSKINVTKETISNGLIVNTFLAAFVVFLVKGETVMIICATIILINLLMVLLFSSNKMWSFSNSFLAYSFNLIISVILLNYSIYGFQKHLNTYSLLIFIGLILLEIAFLIIITFYRYKSIVNNSTKKYSAVPSYAGACGLIGYSLAKFFFSGSSDSIGSIIFTVSVGLIILVLLYIIFGQLLPRYYATKKFEISCYSD